MKLISIAMLMLSMVAASTYSSRLTANSQMPVDVEGASSHIKTLVLGSGCFWGPEKRYENIKGVLDAESGYADGKGFYPSYREITKPSRRFDPNYAEVVKVLIMPTSSVLSVYYSNTLRATIRHKKIVRAMMLVASIVPSCYIRTNNKSKRQSVPKRSFKPC